MYVFCLGRGEGRMGVAYRRHHHCNDLLVRVVAVTVQNNAAEI